MPKAPQLRITHAVDERLGVGHGIYYGVWNMIFTFYVEHNPVAGSSIFMFPFDISCGSR